MLPGSGAVGTQWGGGRVSFHFKIWFLILVQKECGLELGGCESSSPRLLSLSGLSYRQPSLAELHGKGCAVPLLGSGVVHSSSQEHRTSAAVSDKSVVAGQTKGQEVAVSTATQTIEPGEIGSSLLPANGAVTSHLST